MRSFRFILFLIFLSVLFNLRSYAFHTEWESPTLDSAADDPWKHRLSKELPESVLDQLYETNKASFVSKEDFLSAIQMTDSQQQVRMGDFAYDNRLLIGMGEEGRVCLARHLPTGYYTALKTPVRTSEYKAFRNLGRCYACFVKDSQYYIYTPFIMGTPLSEYYLDEERLGVTIDNQNNVEYKKWPHNLRLLDAFLVELERCVKYEGNPREFDFKSIFIIDDSPEEPKVIFVDLETGDYTPKGKDYIPDEFCLAMFRLLGSQGSSGMERLVFPKPIQDFFERASKGDGFHIRLTELKEARNQLMTGMQQLGYPGLNGQASCSSHECSGVILQPC